MGYMGANLRIGLEVLKCEVTLKDSFVSLCEFLLPLSLIFKKRIKTAIDDTVYLQVG